MRKFFKDKNFLVVKLFSKKMVAEQKSSGNGRKCSTMSMTQYSWFIISQTDCLDWIKMSSISLGIMEENALTFQGNITLG